jgi:two-component sensor histidine kinase
MAVHELSTNAVKYGALSTDHGAIKITWAADYEKTDRGFHIRWEERGGPEVKAPAHRGFGTTVVTRMIEMGLGGQTTLEYASYGLIWAYVSPLKKILEERASD